MPIFEEIERKVPYLPGRNEPLFSYLNHSPDADIVRVREVIENWYESYPEEQQNDIRGRFRSGRDDELHSAFFEMLLHQLLSNLGCDMTVHPNVEGVTKQPDFLVKDGALSCYLEAKVVTAQSSPLIPQPNERDAIDKLTSLTSPYFHIRIEMVSKLSRTLSKSRITMPFKRLLEEHDPDEVRCIIEEKGWRNAPSTVVQEGEWVLTGYLYPKSPDDNDWGRETSACTLNNARFLDVGTPVIEELKGKASNYGTPDLPLIIAVNSMDPFFHNRDAEVEALFGKQVLLSGPTGFGHYKNGFWHDGFSSRVSAVWIFRRVDVLNFFGLPDSVSACLYINPNKDRVELPKAIYQTGYSTATFNGGTGSINWTDGENVGSLLGL